MGVGGIPHDPLLLFFSKADRIYLKALDNDKKINNNKGGKAAAQPNLIGRLNRHRFFPLLANPRSARDVKK